MIDAKHKSRAQAQPPQQAPLDIREKGGPKNGQPQFSDRRLFMQIQAFGNCGDPAPLITALASCGLEGALYEDIHDPRGVAVLAISENPDTFISQWRPLFNKWPFADLIPKTDLSMLGRSYALGYEPNLEDWLLHRPRRTVLDPAWPWAVWYPLRRTGAFSRLPHHEQGQILKEHGIIGRAYGDAELARDIRLACTGVDRNDNDFVIGLIGKELYPLSALVQSMRATSQTSTYIQGMGPFFIGKALWQAPAPKP